MEDQFSLLPWAKGANIYEVNLRQYTAQGTFNAFAKELPRLRDMGVEILWFMPVTPISKEKRQGSLGSYYACSDYMQVNPEFGTLNDFKQLVSYAHELGFKVIIDWVVNHTGWDHTWTITNPEFYKKDENGNFYDPNGWVDVIDLDFSNANMRGELLKAMEFWVTETGIDGYRCDMAHLVPLDFWKAARVRLDKLKPLFWLAETQETEYHQVFDVTYAWDFLHTMEAYSKKAIDLQGLREVLERYDRDLPRNAVQLFFTSNHDENSHSGSEYERLGDAAKVFGVLCATWKNAMPLVYSGQELPNKSRLAFFEKDAIQWTGNNLLHSFYKSLLRLHKEHVALQVGDDTIETTWLSPTNGLVMAFRRRKAAEEVVVILNLSAANRVKFSVADADFNGNYRSAFSGIVHRFSAEEMFELQAWDYLVYVKCN